MSNFTESDLKRLDQAISQGVLSVTFADGRTVQFSTFKELAQRREFVSRQLDAKAGKERLLAEFRKGVTS